MAQSLETNAERKRRITEEGYQNHRWGLSLIENPYERGSPEWIWWRHGHNKAVNSAPPTGRAPNWRPGV